MPKLFLMVVFMSVALQVFECIPLPVKKAYELILLTFFFPSQPFNTTSLILSDDVHFRTYTKKEIF